MKHTLIAVLSLMLASPVMAGGHAATGDAVAGEAVFGKQCVACHLVVNGDGEKLAGRNGKSGPNKA